MLEEGCVFHQKRLNAEAASGSLPTLAIDSIRLALSGISVFSKKAKKDGLPRLEITLWK